jgi:hypothetical protein
VQTGIERTNFIQTLLKMKGRLHPCVSDIGNRAQIMRANAIGLIAPTHQTRLIADFPRPVTGAGSIGNAAIKRHAHKRDV